MIQKFTARALEALDRIYSIVGPVSRVDAIDVAPPILVHDVSREAELAAGFPYEWAISLITAGGGVPLTGTARLYELFLIPEVQRRMAAIGLDPIETDVWVRDVSGVITAASVTRLTYVAASVVLGNLTGSGTSLMCQVWNSSSAAMTGGAVALSTSQTAGASFPFARTYPFLLFQDDTTAISLSAQDNSSGALTATAYFHVWIGPRGCLPPGA